MRGGIARFNHVAFKCEAGTIRRCSLAIAKLTLATGTMSVHVVRLGTPRVRGEGTRIGTVSAPDVRRTIELLAVLSQTANFSIGRYCEIEDRCHRSVLRELLLENGALVG